VLVLVGRVLVFTLPLVMPQVSGVGFSWGKCVPFSGCRRTPDPPGAFLRRETRCFPVEMGKLFPWGAQSISWRWPGAIPNKLRLDTWEQVWYNNGRWLVGKSNRTRRLRWRRLK